jgi:hypothetical protein
VSGRTEDLVLKVTRHEVAKQAKWREDQDHPSVKDVWQRSERSRELGSSQDKGPSIGCSKSRGARTRGSEVARRSGPSICEGRVVEIGEISRTRGFAG